MPTGAPDRTNLHPSDILRVWRAGESEQIALRIVGMTSPEAWGALLASLLQTIGQGYALAQGVDYNQTNGRLWRAMQEELRPEGPEYIETEH